MAEVDFRELRRLISMQQVLDLLRFVPAARNGAQLRGPCPLHGSGSDNSGVFSVNLAKNTFQCFKCHAAGNHLDLWARATNKRLYEAALDLCRRVNCEVPWLSAEQGRGNRRGSGEGESGRGE